MLAVFRAYWPSMRKYHLLFVILCISISGAIAFASLRPFLLRNIVNVFTAEEKNVSLAKEIFWQYLMLGVGTFLAYRIFDVALSLYEARIMRDLDQRSFAAIQRQSISFFENAFTGALVKSAGRFRNSFEGIIDVLFVEVGRSILILCFAFVAFFSTMPSFAFAFGAWVVAFLAVGAILIKYRYPLEKASAEADSKVGGACADSIGSHLTVKSFGCEPSEQKRFDTVVVENYQKRLKAWMVGNAGMAMQMIMMMVAEVGLVWWMIGGWAKGTITTGDLVFFQTYMAWILGHLWTFVHSVRKLFILVAEAREMTEVFDLESEVRDAPKAHPLVISEGQIDIHALTFHYGTVYSEKSFAINGIDMKIPPGQSVGLVGRTGAGKSTLVKLLMRLYELDSGYIRIDMQDITDVTQKSLRQQMAVVPQQPQLFHRTIRENIAFACPNASEEDVVEAARQAYAWEFIEKLPDGLDTMVGERGMKLSGGQCQRIAIARAILADPKILLLDEATSALDSETEKYIQKAIANLLRGRTSVVIAHRLSTIMSLDRIVVMENGKIAEDGAHEDLLSAEGMYANLWAHQVRGYV